MPMSLVGSILGPLGTTGSDGAAAISDHGEGYDFAIGGLGFRLAITDERKYERVTAQFRKEQYDTAERVGDQSLVGYWTRGQLSFHEGAGQKYADQVSGTDDARFWESQGVNPFVKGEASLYPSWGAASATAPASPWLSAQGVTEQTVAGMADNKVYIGSLGAALGTYAPAGLVTSMSAGGGAVYCGQGDKKIARVGDTLPVVVSEDFTAGTGGFSTFEGATVATSSASPDGANGAYLDVTWPITGAKDWAAIARFSGLTNGVTYTQVARVWLEVGTGGKVSCGFNYTGAPGTPTITTEGAWHTVAWTFVYGPHSPGFTMTDLDPAVTRKMRVDNFTIYEGVASDYQTGTPSTVLYSHGRNISGVHYAKGRILMVDEDGAWHQLAPNPTGVLPVAVASGDKVFTMSTTKSWSVTETPGPVLLASGSQVFSLAQSEANGLFPTLSAPILVATLPSGEDVLEMSTYLGFVGLVTTRGFRVAVLQDNGTITYGPKVIEFTSSPARTTIARKGDSFVIAADRTIYEVNLAAQVGEGLEFGWAQLPTPFAGTEGSYGVTNCGSTLVAWGGTSMVKQGTSPAATGYLQTGYHRFGTLENKKFQTIHVRGSGAGGTILVSKVTDSGSVVPLYTLDPSQRASADITLRADAPTERLALRFDFTASGANGPTLLGYQLRALPAPQRQRMIRVPLALHDVERRGTTRASGHIGGAWERLRALEALEVEGGVVTFQDFRTGESGQCYIEQVAHEGDTPPGRQGDGFGGCVFVTLRVL
jgi:hypothetical protein